MSQVNQIRAAYDGQTITVYQAYGAAIARPALKQGRFVAPFSLARMTWIKPSFLWLMERSNWGQKPNQDHILAVRIRREGWDEALSLGVLTSYEPGVHAHSGAWRADFEAALVHIQWDPERSIRGADLGINSIQVGLSRHIIGKFVDDWTVEIKDVTPLVRKIHALVKSGKVANARKLLPGERVYPVEADMAKRLGIQH